MIVLCNKAGIERRRKLGITGFHLLTPLLKIGGKELTKMATKALAKGGAKVGGTVAKKVPLLGALVGIGFGVARVFEGQPGLALLEVASGVVSTIPGGGTVASLALDGAIMAADCYDCNERAEVNTY